MNPCAKQSTCNAQCGVSVRQPQKMVPGVIPRHRKSLFYPGILSLETFPLFLQRPQFTQWTFGLDKPFLLARGAIWKATPRRDTPHRRCIPDDQHLWMGHTLESAQLPCVSTVSFLASQLNPSVSCWVIWAWAPMHKYQIHMLHVQSPSSTNMT